MLFIAMNFTGQAQITQISIPQFQHLTLSTDTQADTDFFTYRSFFHDEETQRLFYPENTFLTTNHTNHTNGTSLSFLLLVPTLRVETCGWTLRVRCRSFPGSACECMCRGA